MNANEMTIEEYRESLASRHVRSLMRSLDGAVRLSEGQWRLIPADHLGKARALCEELAERLAVKQSEVPMSISDEADMYRKLYMEFLERVAGHPDL